MLDRRVSAFIGGFYSFSRPAGLKKSVSIIMLSWDEFAGDRVSRWYRREASFEKGPRPESGVVKPRTALHCGDSSFSHPHLYSSCLGQNRRIQPGRPSYPVG